MNRVVCPYLGTLDHNEQPTSAVEYPSLENQCFAAPAGELLLLADQATFCLSGGHRHCPRYQLAQHTADIQATTEDEAIPSPFATDPESSGGLALFGNLAEGFQADHQRARHRWAWAGAAMLFATIFLCGGVIAAYTGWQLVNVRYLAAAPGEIDTLDNGAAPAQEPLYLVMTATSEAVAQPPTLTPAQPPAEQAAQAQAVFPPAVTPTPIRVAPVLSSQTAPNAGEPESNRFANPPPLATAGEDAPPQNVLLPTPEINLQLEIPTRRPTPIFDLPTSTPAVVEPPPTDTPPPIVGTPVVLFAPLQHTLERGQCTLVRWHVENVQAVYYENQGVNGDGEREECIRDKPEVYTLAVILANGSTQIYTTTIDYLPPTPTPTPTPSFTPEFEEQATPTWTPDIPTATPTPPVEFAVGIEIFGDPRHQCNAGNTCEFSVLVSNRGNIADSLMVAFVQTGPWPALLCEDGGNCATSSLTLSNVSANGSRLVRLKINVSGDAAATTAVYSVQAVSGGSGGGVSSSVVTVEVEVP